MFFGSLVKTSCKARGPPVEVPIKTIFLRDVTHLCSFDFSEVAAIGNERPYSFSFSVFF